MCEMGYVNEALKRMKKRYRNMTGSEHSTLWEYWTTEGTLNHAWSGGPLITMSKYIAGIRPVECGYRRFEIKPDLHYLRFVSCEVPAPYGLIKMEIDNTKMKVTIPQGTMADVYVPATSQKYTLSGGNYIL